TPVMPCPCGSAGGAGCSQSRSLSQRQTIHKVAARFREGRSAKRIAAHALFVHSMPFPRLSRTRTSDQIFASGAWGRFGEAQLVLAPLPTRFGPVPLGTPAGVGPL